MLTYIQRQLLLAIPVILGVSILTFLMLTFIPGQAPEILAMQGGTAVSAEDLDRFREELGLNDPVYVQYWNFFSQAIRGDLGRSIRSNRPVVDIISDALPSTFALAVAGMVTAIVLGLALGLVSGLFRGGWLDTVTMVVALFGWSMPSFWLGIILLLVFAMQLGWFPITGQGGLQRLVLPALTLGLGSAGIIARLVRTEIVEQMGREYVTTARAKGLFELQVVVIHVLRNSLISVITIIGLQFGRLLGGTVIVESVFARQGIGRIAVEALLARDMPVLQGTVLLLSVIFVLTNMSVDIAYGFLDPRIRIGARA